MGDFPRKSDGLCVLTVEFKRNVVQQIFEGREDAPICLANWGADQASARSGNGPHLGEPVLILQPAPG